MSADQLESVLRAISDMQSQWGEASTLPDMRSDLENLYLSFAGVETCALTQENVGGVGVERVLAPGADIKRQAILLHGGGFSMGSARSHRHLAQWISSLSHCEVVVPDYRLVPEHVFPAQLEDAYRVYRALLDHAVPSSSIVLMGDSAGGGLALALIAKLRNEGADLPAAACLMSPWVDLECRGASYQTHGRVDPVATHEMALQMGLGYVGPEGDVADPLASPIELSFEAFPPLLIQVGGREIFLDDSRALAERARKNGVRVELQEWPEMIHQWHLYAGVLADARNALKQQAAFLSTIH